MGYIEEINALLVPRNIEEVVVLDLFAGCGGLALGFEAVHSSGPISELRLMELK